MAASPVLAGKRVGGAVYLHVSAVAEASPDVQDRVRHAVATVGSNHAWNVAKVAERAVSLLLYEDFDGVAFPALLASARVAAEDSSVSFIDYRARANPPILHRKETLLRPDDPRRPAFAALTRLAEEHKLFAEPHRIGTRKAWLERVEAAGLVVQGARLLHRETAPVDVVRHRTAIIRRDLSQPVQMLVSHRIVTESTTVLDYGCGQGDDVAALAANGFQAFGWDPHYAPDGPRRPADVVNLGFVLNVIEDRHERAETLMAAYGFARRALSVAVMPLGKYPFDGLRPYGDGYVTARGTFQKYFAQQELRDFIAQALGEAPVAFAPGIFVVFRDKELEQEVLFKRQARDIVRPVGLRPPERERRAVPARPELADRIRPELEVLWTAISGARPRPRCRGISGWTSRPAPCREGVAGAGNRNLPVRPVQSRPVGGSRCNPPGRSPHPPFANPVPRRAPLRNTGALDPKGPSRFLWQPRRRDPGSQCAAVLRGQGGRRA